VKSGLQGHCLHKKVNRQKVLELLARREGRAIGSVLRAWRGATAQEASHRTRMLQCLARLHKQCLHSAFGGWREAVAAKGVRRAMGKRAVQVITILPFRTLTLEDVAILKAFTPLQCSLFNHCNVCFSTLANFSSMAMISFQHCTCLLSSHRRSTICIFLGLYSGTPA